VLPNSIRINRGAYVIKDLVELTGKQDFTDLVILHEHRGEPDGLILCHLPLGPTLYFGLKNVTLRHDLPIKPDPLPLQHPHLLFPAFTTPLGLRIQSVLTHLFPVPKHDSSRVVTFSNQDDIISFRNHQYQKEDYKTIGLNELGPRFEMKCYQIALGKLSFLNLLKGSWARKKPRRSGC